MYAYVFIKLYVVCMCLYVCVHKRHTSFYQASQYYTSQMLHFLQVTDKTLHQQKDYDDSLYCDGLEPNPQCLGDMPLYHFVCAYVRGKEEVLNNACEKRSL